MSAALHQSWPPFVLIAGLLLIGLLANRDGLFAWGGARLQALPGGGVALLGAALLLDAVVTAVLNLDTAVVFLTPVLVFAARRRRVAVEPFLYGCVFMANASSLFLPGSNLTNLLVLDAHGGGCRGELRGEDVPARDHRGGGDRGRGRGIRFRRHLRPQPVPRRGRVDRATRSADAATAPTPRRRSSSAPASLATVAAVVLVLVVRRHATALAVLAVGLLATAVELAPPRIDLADVWRVLGLPSLAAAFVLTVALGTLARHWDGPAELIGGASGPETAGLAAISTVFVNNLPSAALYSAHAVDHSRMLLLGLNVGPNLAVTGALSALLWFRAAREVDARPSLLEFSRRGVPLALVAMAAAIVVGMLT